MRRGWQPRTVATDQLRGPAAFEALETVIASYGTLAGSPPAGLLATHVVVAVHDLRGFRWAASVYETERTQNEHLTSKVEESCK